jgi:hypothetical protein
VIVWIPVFEFIGRSHVGSEVRLCFKDTDEVFLFGG